MKDGLFATLFAAIITVIILGAYGESIDDCDDADFSWREDCYKIFDALTGSLD